MGRVGSLTIEKIKYRPVMIAQYMFMIIFTGIIVLSFILGGGKLMDQLFSSSVMTVQSVVTFTFPFCYLVMKAVRKALETEKEMAKVPLIFMTAAQIMNFNFICVVFLVSGLFLEYGAGWFRIQKGTLRSSQMWVDAGGAGALIILLFSVLTLSIKYRLGMF